MSSMRTMFGVALLTGFFAPHAGATTAIRSHDAFAGVPSILVDFETQGDGTPFNLAENEAIPADAGQFLEPHGFTVFADFTIANASGAEFEAALAEVGSLQHTTFLLGGSGSQVGFIFRREDVYSAGIAIVRNTDFITGPLILRVRDRNAQLIAEIEYDASYIHGNFGKIDFGFIGFASDVPIGNFLFDFNAQDDIAISYDDFIFSTQTVPAPGGAVVMGLAALTLCTRRRSSGQYRRGNRNL